MKQTVLLIFCTFVSWVVGGSSLWGCCWVQTQQVCYENEFTSTFYPWEEKKIWKWIRKKISVFCSEALSRDVQILKIIIRPVLGHSGEAWPVTHPIWYTWSYYLKRWENITPKSSAQDVLNSSGSRLRALQVREEMGKKKESLWHTKKESSH